MRHWLRNLIVLIVVLGLVAVAGAWYVHRSQGPEVSYKTDEVKRGQIVATINATGTVEPEDSIDVGAQVAGRITQFGNDVSGKPVDYGSQVKENAVLARIDPVLYQSDVAAAKAQLEQGKAGVVRAQADLGQYQAKYTQAQRDWSRAQKLGPSDALSQADYDMYQSNYEAAKANVAVGQAEVTQAQATVSQAQATLDRAQQNLNYCTITSPVNGVIIARRVNIGQTVVSSLSAPSLFLIAKDLTKMQVWASVNEADIGNIKVGQNASFTVDTYPDRKFKGIVSQVRLDATMTQNVVTYTVVITADNSDNALFPYMTATVEFEVSKHENVLLTTNAALRWSPTDTSQIDPQYRDEGESGESGAASGGQGDQTQGNGEKNHAHHGGASSRPSPDHASSGLHQHGVVWVEDGDFVKPIQVRLGVTDGINTEIMSGEIKAGDKLVIGEETAESASAGGARNPFMPQFHHHKK